MAKYLGVLLKINGSTIPAIKSYEVQRAKLWKEATRNMSGDLKATLIGIFPKIEIEIGYLYQSQLSDLIKLLDKPFFDVTYFDARTEATKTARYYASDYNVTIHNKQMGLYKPFKVSLIPLNKVKY